MCYATYDTRLTPQGISAFPKFCAINYGRTTTIIIIIVVVVVVFSFFSTSTPFTD
jgi:hypothetical protein